MRTADLEKDKKLFTVTVLTLKTIINLTERNSEIAISKAVDVVPMVRACGKGKRAHAHH